MSTLSRIKERQREASRDARIALSAIANLEPHELEALRVLAAGMTRGKVDAICHALSIPYGPRAVLAFSRALGAVLEVLHNGITVGSPAAAVSRGRTAGDVDDDTRSPFGLPPDGDEP